MSKPSAKRHERPKAEGLWALGGALGALAGAQLWARALWRRCAQGEALVLLALGGTGRGGGSLGRVGLEVSGDVVAEPLGRNLGKLAVLDHAV